MTYCTKIIACLAAGLVCGLTLVPAAPARAQDEPGGKTFPERQLEKRNKERRELKREQDKRDPFEPLYVPGGTRLTPWSAPAPNASGGKFPWNAN